MTVPARTPLPRHRWLLTCAWAACVALALPALARAQPSGKPPTALAANLAPAAARGEAPSVEPRLREIERLSKRDPQRAQREIAALGDVPLSTHGRVRLAAARAQMAVFQFDMDAALAAVEGNLPQALALDDPRLIGLLLISQARALLETNRGAEAATRALQALDQAERSGDSGLRIDVRVLLAEHAGRRSDFERAFTLLEEAGQLARASNDVALLALVAYTDAGLSTMIGDLPAAQRGFAEAEEAFRVDGDVLGEADAARNLAQQLLTTGRHAEAVEPLNRALARFAALEDTFGLAVAKGQLAYALAETGEIERAFALHGEALAALRPGSHGDSLTHLLIGRLQMIVDHQRGAGALPLIEEIDRRVGKSDDLQMRMRSRRVAADAYAVLGRYREAHTALSEYLKFKAHHDDQRLAFQLSAQRGRLESQRMAAELDRAQRIAQEQRDALARAERAVRWQTALILLAVLAIAAALYALLRITQRSRRNSALAHTDYLTGVPNRRRICELGQRLLARCRKRGEPFSLLLLDLDRFKSINDEFGHEAGDRALQAVTAELQHHLRGGDELGRYGGEEFAVVLPATPTERALAIADRLRQAVASLSATTLGFRRSLTVSVGVATAENERDFAALVARADRAMYLAKHEGRDRVLMAPSADDLRPAPVAAGSGRTPPSNRPAAELAQAE
jgi:diguanylate cyclase (GGDEF)-like protein